MSVVKLRSKHEINKVKRSAEASSQILKMIGDEIKPGINTYDLEMVSQQAISDLGVKSSFIGYTDGKHDPYPASICVSVNDVVIHGIPKKSEILKEGDIIGIDIAVNIDGFHADNGFTFTVGSIPDKTQKLLDVTKQSLYNAISLAKHGNRMGDISHQLYNTAVKNNFSVVENFAGHGICRSVHEPPQIPTIGTPGTGIRLRTGMILAIEAMVNIGKPGIDIKDDGWRVVTSDGSLSAFYEHTVVITSDKPDILTDSSIWHN